jgi:hypothetical protein
MYSSINLKSWRICCGLKKAMRPCIALTSGFIEPVSDDNYRAYR